MHRTFVAAKERSVRTSSNGDSTSSDTLLDADRIDASVCVDVLPPLNVVSPRQKELHSRNRRRMEILDLTETDVTETTVTLRSEEIVEQSSYLMPLASSQLFIEDMVHRLREVNGDDVEVQQAIAPELNVNYATIVAMTSRLRKANHPPSRRISQRYVGSTARWEHHRTDSLALRRPCRTATVRTVDEEPAVQSSHRDRMKSSVGGVADHTSHIPFSELIDRLHRVNKEIATEPKLHVTLQRKAKISITKSDDDLARILHQVNQRCAVAEGIDESDCDVRKPPPIPAQSFDREYLSSYSSSWIEEECGTATSADYLALAAHGKHTPAFGDLCSHLADDDDDDSGCTLHASARSCDSSVTWYEGSDIDEILLDDDDVSAAIDFGSVDENSFST
jgi:hypothetical protein